ncbi:hypothetical protein ACIG87_20115 [Micromonospora sp. NPDC051925]|uniref:hypothetical protein n=1 Tax=Micromonospora sp. NPDC051925 TaxID=3364288 RepID=UPI0037CC9FAA
MADHIAAFDAALLISRSTSVAVAAARDAARIGDVEGERPDAGVVPVLRGTRGGVDLCRTPFQRLPHELHAESAVRPGHAKWRASPHSPFGDGPHLTGSTLQDGQSPMKPACDPLIERTGRFLDSAKAAGDLVGPFTVDEVYQLVLALSWAVDRFDDDEAAARKRVAMATTGIFTPF